MTSKAILPYEPKRPPGNMTEAAIQKCHCVNTLHFIDEEIKRLRRERRKWNKLLRERLKAIRRFAGDNH